MGRTHEALTGFADNQRREFPNAFFWEPEKSEATHQQKLNRDLEVLLDEVKTNPTDARWWCYLGQTYECLKQYTDAVDAYRQCANRDGWAAESSSACYRAALCLKEIGSFRAAEEQAAFGLTRLPRSPELLWMAGFCAYQLGAMQWSIDWCELALQCGDYTNPELGNNRMQIVYRHPTAAYESPYDVLRFAYRRTGQVDKALLA